METKKMQERKRVNLKLDPAVHADLVRYARRRKLTVQTVVAGLVIAAVCGKEVTPQKHTAKRKR